MSYLGDFVAGQSVYCKWNTQGADGASITRATNGQVRVYKDASDAQSTTGVTDTEDFDTLTGVHHITVDTSADGTFYAAGHEFAIVLQGATIDGKTVNSALHHFSIQRTSAVPAQLLDGTSAIETNITLRYAIRLMLAALAGKLSGAATTTVTIRNVGDSKDRITATVDADGNRSAVTVDGS